MKSFFSECPKIYQFRLLAIKLPFISEYQKLTGRARFRPAGPARDVELSCSMGRFVFEAQAFGVDRFGFVNG
jgi:hypothetical protein